MILSNGWGRRFTIALLMLSGASADGWADRVATPSTKSAIALHPIGEQRLDTLEPAARQRIAELRSRLHDALERSAAAADLAELYGRLGGLYFANQLDAPAVPAFANARLLDPRQFRWAYYLAHLALKAGESERALELLQAAADIDPKYPPLALRKAEALLSLNRLDMAAQAYTKASTDPDRRPAALYGLAQIDQLNRDWASAATRLQEVLALQPEADVAKYSLGLVLMRLNRREEARPLLARPGVNKPVYPDLLVAELDALRDPARFHFGRAMQAISHGDHQAAVEHFAAGLQHQPQNARARTSYARALWISGDQEQARVELRRAVADGGDETLPRFLGAVVAEARGEYDFAEAGYREVIDMDPDHAGALSYLAGLTARQRRFAAAAEPFDRAIAAGVNMFPVHLQYWGALRGAGRPTQELLERLDQLAQRFPESPVFDYLRIKLLATTGQPDAALALCRDFNQRYPAPPHVELLVFTLALAGEWQAAGERLADLLAQAREIGAHDIVERLSGMANSLERRKLPEPLWPLDDPLTLPPAVDPSVPISNYPAAHPV